MVDFFVDYFDGILWVIGIILSCSLGYIFGSLSSIKNDIKSLDYDNLLSKYNDLDRIVQIKKKR